MEKTKDKTPLQKKNKTKTNNIELFFYKTLYSRLGQMQLNAVKLMIALAANAH